MRIRHHWGFWKKYVDVYKEDSKKWILKLLHILLDHDSENEYIYLHNDINFLWLSN